MVEEGEMLLLLVSVILDYISLLLGERHRPRGDLRGSGWRVWGVMMTW